MSWTIEDCLNHARHLNSLGEKEEYDKNFKTNCIPWPIAGGGRRKRYKTNRRRVKTNRRRVKTNRRRVKTNRRRRKH